MTITGAARVAGVMGWPIDHSLSPRVHGYWLTQYGIDGAYIPLAVQPDRLEEALRALPALGIAGVNLTVPHKEAAVAIVDFCDETAKRIGAINTILIRTDGSIEGRNTDGYGFLQSIADDAKDWKASDGPITIIGAGGAARAICVTLLDAGASEIRIANRTSERVDALVEELGQKLISVPWAERADALDGVTLLVNATTLGMRGQGMLELPLDPLPQSAVVADIVYAPLKTPLLQSASARGNVTIDGLGMLLHQARPGFAAWFDKEPDVTQALRDYVLDQNGNSTG